MNRYALEMYAREYLENAQADARSRSRIPPKRPALFGLFHRRESPAIDLPDELSKVESTPLPLESYFDFVDFDLDEYLPKVK
jgi:hypothetical protein